jgi:hypothetical protein
MTIRITAIKTTMITIMVVLELEDEPGGADVVDDDGFIWYREQMGLLKNGF